MINYIWLFFIVSSVIIGFFTGRLKEVGDAAIEYADIAVRLSIALVGVMSLWLGFMKIAEESGLVFLFSKLIKPIIKRLFPDIPADSKAAVDITMNISANALGLNNAATPFGLQAMKELQKHNNNPDKSVASDSMCTFLAINTAGIQFIPASVMAVLAASGSSNPAEIIAPCIITTFIVLFIAIIIVKVLERVYPEPSKRLRAKEGGSDA